MAAQIMTREEMQRRLSQLPAEDPDMTEKVFLEYIRSGYIIYDGRNHKAACTRCGKEWDLYPGEYAQTHGTRETCPECGEVCTLLSAGRGRKTYTEYHRLLHFAEHEGTIWGFLNTIIADFEPMGRPELYHSLDEIYIINKTEQSRWSKRYSYGSGWHFERVNNTKVPPAPAAPYCASKYIDHIYTDRLMDMIARSDCRYLADNITDYPGMDLPSYLGTAMKYHSVELLTKAGFSRIANWKISGNGCRRVNWRADSLDRILKLPKADVRRIRPYNPSCRELEAYQQLTPEERRVISMPILRDMLSHTNYDYKTRRYENTYKKKVGKYMSFDKWIRWAKTQEYYSKPNDICPHLLTDYADYMKMMEKLGMDIHKKSIIRPKNLKQAHDDAIERIRSERDAAIERAMAKNARSDTFAAFGLMIVPAKTQEDLNMESAKLHHCVKTYGTKVADGRCFIFFVRNAKKPDEPYYTLETRPNGDFVQCRGLRNCSMTDEVKLFTDAFTKKLKKEIRKEKEAKACQTAQTAS